MPRGYPWGSEGHLLGPHHVMKVPEVHPKGHHLDLEGVPVAGLVQHASGVCTA